MDRMDEMDVLWIALKHQASESASIESKVAILSICLVLRQVSFPGHGIPPFCQDWEK